ncbi:MAG: hypothetical protein KDC84_14670 [Crocinitomicaceae bacterium]|nr:hypothetical protein [Crocinitomicaceae bacterium]
MTAKKLKFSYLIVAFTLILEGYFVLNGQLSFGTGLGDLGMLFMLLITIVFWGILVLVKNPYKEIQARKYRIGMFVGILLTLLYFVLQLDFLFGGSHPGIPIW